MDLPSYSQPEHTFVRDSQQSAKRVKTCSAEAAVTPLTVPTPLQPLQKPEGDFCGTEALVALMNFVTQEAAATPLTALTALTASELTQA